MKRIDNLFEQVYKFDNIELADKKARKCKHNYGIKKHDQHPFSDNFILSLSMEDGTYKTSKYSKFKIYEPKERIIFRLPYYPDRIAHHAVMNITEPIWIKIFTRDTYSCIKGRGIHSLVQKLQKDLKKDPEGTTYCAKMDIKKFYPSINHEILKEIIRKKIKDKELLKFLDEIINSAEGVPIGNYLSQYFANLYLAYFDHWIKEELKVKYYYRYADDIVLLSNDKQKLRNWILAIKVYLVHVLKLKLKDNYQIFPVESRGIDFVGYVVRHNYTLLRKSIKSRIFRLINTYKNKQITKQELEIRLTSYFGWLKYCNSKNLLNKIYKETGIYFSGWKGKRVNIRQFVGKWIYVVHLEVRKTYFLIQFVYNRRSYEIKSRNKKLFMYLVSRQNYPITIKIEYVHSNQSKLRH